MVRLAITVFVTFLSLFAQAKVHDYPNKLLHLSLSFDVPEYTFDFTNEESGANVAYKPNLHELTTPGVSYAGLVGVSWGFKSNISDGDKINLGETKYEDWRFNYAFNAFMAGVHYSQYTGFYIENSENIDSSFAEQELKIQLPDMYVRTIGGHFTWIWDHDRFSMPGIVDQTERQESSGGSWLFGGAISETVFNNSSGLIPAAVNSKFAGAQGLKEGKFLSLVAKGGYGYTLGSKWYVGGVIQLGLGMQNRRLSFQNGTSTRGWDPAWRGEVQIAGGYNGNDFYSGVKLYSFGNIYNGAGMQINSTQLNGSFFLGVHI